MKPKTPRQTFLELSTWISASLLTVTLVLACASGSYGPDIVPMVLPVGDPEMGDLVFRSMECGSCHEVQDHPDLLRAHRISAAPTLILGNPDFKAGDWASAIIAPAHEVRWRETQPESELRQLDMPDYYDSITVGELMDLVAFLERGNQP